VEDGDYRDEQSIHRRYRPAWMRKLSFMSDGTMMRIRNHIPFNVPGEAVKFCFDLNAEPSYR
jgi:hypothetical protein